MVSAARLASLEGVDLGGRCQSKAAMQAVESWRRYAVAVNLEAPFSYAAVSDSLRPYSSQTGRPVRAGGPVEVRWKGPMASGRMAARHRPGRRNKGRKSLIYLLDARRQGEGYGGNAREVSHTRSEP